MSFDFLISFDVLWCLGCPCMSFDVCWFSFNVLWVSYISCYLFVEFLCFSLYFSDFIDFLYLPLISYDFILCLLILCVSFEFNLYPLILGIVVPNFNLCTYSWDMLLAPEVAPYIYIANHTSVLLYLRGLRRRLRPIYIYSRMKDFCQFD